jgi:uncharacterized membrane protein
MKNIIGIALIAVGIAAGLYLGVWLCFIGGIIQFIDAVKADPVSSSGVAWGIARVVFASAVGWICAVIPSCIGIGMLKH